MMAHAYKPSTTETETEAEELKGRAALHHTRSLYKDFKASLLTSDPVLRDKNRTLEFPV